MYRSSTFGLCIALCSLTPTWAAIITVGSDSGGMGDPDCTLRNAIIAANTDAASAGCPAGSGADTISLPADATISLTTIDNYREGPNGLPSITSEIIINGNGTVVQRDGADEILFFRIFHIGEFGNLTLNDLTVSNGFSISYANAGGGILNRGTLTLTNSTVSGNAVHGSPGGGRGGGIWNAIGGALTLMSCAVSDNTVDYRGGGIWNHGTLTLTNCVVSDNASAHYGGGILNRGVATLTNCAVSGNADGGIAVFTGATLELTNSIVWGNDLKAAIFGPATVSYSDVQGGWKGVGNIDADPLFDNDYRLTAGSLCIDAADNTAVPEGVVTDLAGNPRFVDDPNTNDTGFGAPPIVDMGAYEFQPQDPCECVDGEVALCHIPPGNLANAHTITVGCAARDKHLAHGDHCGPCEDGGG